MFDKFKASLVTRGDEQDKEIYKISVVKLNKAQYGCVEAKTFWYADPYATLTRDRYAPNGYDPCIFNKIGADGDHISAPIHVDGLFVVSMPNDNLEKFEKKCGMSTLRS